MARIEPLEKPYPPDAAAFLDGSMPRWAGLEPIKLFRIWGRHPEMALALKPLGGFILAGGSLAAEDRELLILRTCARCAAEYEWGIHAVGHAKRVGLSDETINATTSAPADSEHFSERQQQLVRLADALHDSATIDSVSWAALAARYDERQLLELFLVVGFYHFVSFSVNALAVEHEEWAVRFPAER